MLVLRPGELACQGLMECEPVIDQASRVHPTWRFHKGEKHSDGGTQEALPVTLRELLLCMSTMRM
jgi:hypothetical protein